MGWLVRLGRFVGLASGRKEFSRKEAVLSASARFLFCALQFKSPSPAVLLFLFCNDLEVVDTPPRSLCSNHRFFFSESVTSHPVRRRIRTSSEWEVLDASGTEALSSEAISRHQGIKVSHLLAPTSPSGQAANGLTTTNRQRTSALSQAKLHVARRPLTVNSHCHTPCDRSE